MESAGTPAPAVEPVEDEGLKPNAMGFVDGLSIGLASTAPAYSLAASVRSSSSSACRRRPPC